MPSRRSGEDQKVAIRNARRDGNKHADALKAGGKFPEDELETLKSEIQDLLKKYEGEVDKAIESKSKEIMQV